jgi:hypothetical protein
VPRLSNSRCSSAGAGIALAALALAGCGGGGDSSSQATGRTAAAAKPPAAQDRSLTRPGTAGAAVKATLQYIELGALAAAIAQYEPATVHSVDIADFAGGVQSLATSIAPGKARVVAVKPSKGGAIVVVALHRSNQTKSRYAFTLRMSGKGWRIAYDSLMDDAIRSAATSRAQSRFTPNEARTSPQASAAGIRASSAFRAAGLRGP